MDLSPYIIHLQRNESELGKPHFADFGNVLLVTYKTDEQRFKREMKETWNENGLSLRLFTRSWLRLYLV